MANKYHEGEVKRTLKRELKVLEIAEREANGTSTHRRWILIQPLRTATLKHHFPQ
jgi:hypothetical protein